MMMDIAISWPLAATILGVLGIIVGALINIFGPKSKIDTISSSIDDINKKVNGNYNTSQVYFKEVDGRLDALEDDIKGINQTLDKINDDRKKDVEKIEIKIDKLNDLILRLMHDNK